VIEAGQKGKEGANQATPQVADRRKNHIHQTTAHRVGKYRPDATEDLSIKNMTASAKGTAENPGNNVTEKAGLPHDPGHRAGGASHYPCTKAEGWVSVILLSPRRNRSSHTCPFCGRIRKKQMSEREHRGGCSFSATRDQAAVLSTLADGLQGPKLHLEPCKWLRWGRSSDRHGLVRPDNHIASVPCHGG
jgi:putative transposase